MVELPATAGEQLWLEEDASRMRVGIRLNGASRAAPAIDDDLAVFPGGFRGGDVAVRVDPLGIEDFVRFDTPPKERELVYAVDVSAAAGLRLVGDVLELLDFSGTPRIRAAAPYVVDRNGRRTPGHLGVSGCAFDASPAAPWGRPVVNPGATCCNVHVTWDHVLYPAVVDPRWAATKGTMLSARSSHTAHLLPNGKVLFADGNEDGTNGSCVQASELYDPATDTFAASGSFQTARCGPVGVSLGSGDVLFFGGYAEPHHPPEITSGEVYDAALGTFSLTGSLNVVKSNQTAVTLASGKALILGGTTPDVGFIVTKDVEIFDPATKKFTLTSPSKVARYSPSLVLLPDKHLLVVGGTNGGSNTAEEAASAELYDEDAGTFSLTGAMIAGVTSPGVVLDPHRVLFAGNGLLLTQIYDIPSGTFSATASLDDQRAGAALTLLSTGAALLSGGIGPQVGSEPRDTTLIYDPIKNRFRPGVTMRLGRVNHTQTLLPSGKVLVAGGTTVYAGEVPTNTAEVLSDLPLGGACSENDECGSGFCAYGICCDQACDKTCEACNLPGAVGTCSPVVGPPVAPHTCAGDGTACAGSCDGILRTACTFAPVDQRCSNACRGATERTSACDGAGNCVPRAPHTCAQNLTCEEDTTRCRTRCTSNDHCTGGLSCGPDGACVTRGSCSDDRTLRGLNRTVQSCSPYICEAKEGACKTKCATVDDCAAPAVCDPSGQCVYGTGSDSSGCAVPPGDEPTRFPWLVAAVAGVVVFRRRMKREQS